MIDLPKDGIIVIIDNDEGKFLAQYNNHEDARKFLCDITSSGYPTKGFSSAVQANNIGVLRDVSKPLGSSLLGLGFHCAK